MWGRHCRALRFLSSNETNEQWRPGFCQWNFIPALSFSFSAEEIVKTVTWLLTKRSLSNAKSSTKPSFLSFHLLAADLNGDFRKTYATHWTKLLESIILLLLFEVTEHGVSFLYWTILFIKKTIFFSLDNPERVSRLRSLFSLYHCVLDIGWIYLTAMKKSTTAA